MAQSKLRFIPNRFYVVDDSGNKVIGPTTLWKCCWIMMGILLVKPDAKHEICYEAESRLAKVDILSKGRNGTMYSTCTGPEKRDILNKISYFLILHDGESHYFYMSVERCDVNAISMISACSVTQYNINDPFEYERSDAYESIK